MPPLTPFLYAVPAAAALVLLGWRPWLGDERAPRPFSAALASSLACAVAALSAYYGLKEAWPPFPPEEALHWTVYGGVAAVALLPLEREKKHVALALGAFGVGVGLWYAMAPYREYHWDTTAKAVRWLVGLFVVAVTHLALSLDLAGRRAAGPSLPLAHAIVFGGIAATVALSNGGTGLVAAGAACAPGCLAAVALVRPGLEVSRGTAAPLAALSYGLLLVGVFFAETPRLSALLLLLAPQLVRVPGGGWKGIVLRTALVAAVVGAAFAFAYEPPIDDPYGY